MKYHHQLVYQPHIRKNLLDAWSQRLVGQTSAHSIFQTPEILDSVQRYVSAARLSINNAKFFLTAPNFKSMVHTDAGGRLCALNIPLHVPLASGRMNWFAAPWQATVQMVDGAEYLRMASPEQSVVYTGKAAALATERSLAYTEHAVSVDSLLMTAPTIVRTNHWHNVDNTGNMEPRVMYSIRFNQNPTFEELIERFSTIGTIYA